MVYLLGLEYSVLGVYIEGVKFISYIFESLPSDLSKCDVTTRLYKNWYYNWAYLAFVLEFGKWSKLSNLLKWGFPLVSSVVNLGLPFILP